MDSCPKPGATRLDENFYLIGREVLLASLLFGALLDKVNTAKNPRSVSADV